MVYHIVICKPQVQTMQRTKTSGKLPNRKIHWNNQRIGFCDDLQLSLFVKVEGSTQAGFIPDSSPQL
jgi:hypothetical protein